MKILLALIILLIVGCDNVETELIENELATCEGQVEVLAYSLDQCEIGFHLYKLHNKNDYDNLQICLEQSKDLRRRLDELPNNYEAIIDKLQDEIVELKKGVVGVYPIQDIKGFKDCVNNGWDDSLNSTTPNSEDVKYILDLTLLLESQITFGEFEVEVNKNRFKRTFNFHVADINKRTYYVTFIEEMGCETYIGYLRVQQSSPNNTTETEHLDLNRGETYMILANLP